MFDNKAHFSDFLAHFLIFIATRPFSLLAFLCVAYLSAFLSSLALQGTNIAIQAGFNYKFMKIFFAAAPRAQMGV